MIEWHSQVLLHYQRRTKTVDDAILGLYLCGANTHRIKKALRPLLKDTPLDLRIAAREYGWIQHYD